MKGNSVIGAAAYQSGDKLYSEYQHEWKSGDHLERIIHKEILLPPNAPEKYRDRATLWNAVDASEAKSTAQTARRIIVALPKELSREQNIELIRNYCQTSFVDRGMIADFAVHDDDEGNPHAHVLLTISDHEKLENPGDFPLYEVLFVYYDLRKKERWYWNIYAQNKAGAKDLQTLSRTIIFLKEHNINTINDLAVLMTKTSDRIGELNAAKRTKEQRIRDIDAIMEADKTIRELGSILEKYNSIRYKRPKEKYEQEHADEIEKVKNAQRLLYKLKVTLPINKKALKAESSQLRGEVESMLPELETVKAEMDQLKIFRSQVRKVLPEALTVKYEEGKKSFQDMSEEIHNKDELRKLMEESAERAIRHAEEQRHMQQEQKYRQQKEKGVL